MAVIKATISWRNALVVVIVLGSVQAKLPAQQQGNAPAQGAAALPAPIGGDKVALPVGRQGPASLVIDNFYVLKFK